MNLHTWTAVIVYAIMCSAAGLNILTLFRIKKHRLTHNWAFCYLSGQLVVLLLTLLTAFLPFGIYGARLFLILFAFIGIALHTFRRPAGTAEFLATGFAAVLVSGLMFPDVWLATQYAPLVTWDARSYWFFHGKVIMAQGEIGPSFFGNPVYAWAHCDYPVFLASQAAWVSSFAGEWDDIVCKAFLWINFAAYIDIFRRLLQDRLNRWWFWIPAALFMFDRETYSYVSGIADPHYAMPLVLMLYGACPGKGKTPLVFTAVMTAFAANVKNEGAVYAGLAIAAAAAIVTVRKTRKTETRILLTARRARQLAPGFLLGIVPWCLWLTYRIANGIKERDRVIEKIFDLRALVSNLPGRLRPIAEYFAENYAVRRAPLFAAIIILLMLIRRLSGRRSGASPETAGHLPGLWIVFAAVNLCVFLPYTVTPLDLSYHLGTSAGRLLMFPFLVLALILIENVRITISPPEGR